MVQHFPASAAFIVSDDEKQDVAKNYVGKTIADYTPDLKARDDRLESAASASGYVLMSIMRLPISKGISSTLSLWWATPSAVRQA
ncbi:Uncharacterised protein [Klebsiella variicola]|nr:Uncharacterised protein [Klebsiella variicola]